MTPLRKRLLDEIERRNYTQATAHAYVSAIRRFADYFHRSPEKLGIEHVREYQLHRLEQNVKPHSIAVEISALRFLYNKVLRRRFSRDDLPMPRTHRRDLPLVLSADEVARLIDAAPNLRYRTILMTLYSTGMRRAELCGMRPEHIDKERMMLRIPHGKGDKPRDVPLSPILLEQLRAYYRSLKRRNGWMFPSRNTSRPHAPSRTKPSGTPAAALRSAPASTSRSIRIRYATPLPPICSTTAPSCPSSNASSAMRTRATR